MEERKEPQFFVSSSPHAREGTTVRGIMLCVVAALLPACAAGIRFFGARAALLLAVCVGTSLATEAVCRALMRRPQTLGDGSALVTGILLALNLPAGLPLWMAALGSVVAVGVAKQLFGGLGYNPFNPALVGRAFLLISFTAAMTTWTPSDWMREAAPAEEVRVSASEAGENAAFDATTTATPLGVAKDFFKKAREAKAEAAEKGLSAPETGRPFAWNRAARARMFLGDVNGSMGETSALALLLGGLFLLWRKVITWHVPVAFLGTVAVYAGVQNMVAPEFAMPVDFHLLSGGLLLGAIYMATDMVTTPVTRSGLLIFGAGCGLLTMIFRTVPTSSYPEGVSFAILIMNATTPLINRATRPRRFGTKK